MPSERPLDSAEVSSKTTTRTRRTTRRRDVDRESLPEVPVEQLATEERPRTRRPSRAKKVAETSAEEVMEQKPARKSTRRTSARPSEENNYVEDDFGQGLDVDPPSPPEKSWRSTSRRASSTSRNREESTPAVEQPRPVETTPSPEERSYAAVRPHSEERSHGEERSYGSRDGGQGDATPRRRRRRRRTPAPSGSGSSNSGHRSQQNQHEGSYSNSHGQSRGSSGNRGNRGNRGGRRSDRSHANTTTVSNEVTGVIEGVLELHPKGYGFLRDPKNNYSARETDPFVSSTMIEKHRLREGITIRGDVGPGAKGQGPRLKSIETIDGNSVEHFQSVKNFDELTPINPFEQIVLERGPEPVTMRVMDLLTPIGKGQRALIVAPPRSGKTMLLQDIADSVSVNHPEVHLIVLLIDERPEEVTEMRRRVKGEVVASSLDREVESHVRVSQLVVERAKRLAESGKDVFILLDSITRLARAFNKWVNNSGRTGTGGLDIRALDIPKKMFGTARRFEEGGSLTVIGTALVETGGRMDDAIFQEFKGTGNMELVLSRELADRRIWPAIDIAQSGTRREEKILQPKVLEGATLLRRSLISLTPVQAMEDLVRTLRKFPSNSEFMDRVQQVL